MSDSATYTFWLTFRRNEPSRSRREPDLPRVTRDPPRTRKDERSVRCEVTLPVEIFDPPVVRIKADMARAEVPALDLETALQGFPASFSLSTGEEA